VSSHDESAPSWERWSGAGSRDELRRLQLIERAYDAYTIAHLERTGVTRGWRCLEVGAGAGSIAAWMAGRAGAGNVTATELFPEYLDGLAERGVRVLRHDVTVDAPAGADFDLIHARLLLEHLQSRDQVLERLASWLAPGGWLVVEDVAFVPAIAVRPALRHLEEVWLALATATVGTDLTWARTFPLPLERAGLTDTAAEVSTPVLRGGSAVAAAFEASVRVGDSAMIAAGAITSEELEEVYALCADPSVVDYSYQVLVAWGRRPPADQTT
jgi:2-polyprenyl-3-methyl-5-hydroxy-6-metoxy-1,4-benzoquinol methylase